MPQPTESTLSLLQRARAGDRLAFDALFARCLPMLRRWAAGRLPHYARDIHDTVDLVQDVLLQTLRQLDRFQPQREGALQAYLRSALLNRIRDELRRAARRAPAAALDEQRDLASDPSPLELAIGRETLDRYEAALARLDPGEREVLIARLELGYSYEQVAAAVGRPTAEAARQAVRRAMLRLAREMGDAA